MTKPRNWQQIIAEIKAGHLADTGRELTDYKLGVLSGCETRAITRLAEKEGAEPRESEAARLLEIHRGFRLFM